MIGQLFTWRERLDDALTENEESWDDVVYVDAKEGALDVPFDAGFGGDRHDFRPWFRLWTTRTVYFVRDYDGSVYVDSEDRHPPKAP